MISAADIRIYEVLEQTLSQRYSDSEVAGLLDNVRQTYYDSYTTSIDASVVESSIIGCRACDNVTSTPHAGWWNYLDPDFLIVASNSYRDKMYIKATGHALKSAGYASSFCGVIHVTKCDAEKITPSNVDNCYNFVYQQISAARPRAIGVTGAKAFDLFRTNQDSYKDAIGTSWWWGVHKVYCLPLLADIAENYSISILKETYEHVYGISGSDLIVIRQNE